jgi:hypothetical protein
MSGVMTAVMGSMGKKLSNTLVTIGTTFSGGDWYGRGNGSVTGNVTFGSATGDIVPLTVNRGSSHFVGSIVGGANATDFGLFVNSTLNTQSSFVGLRVTDSTGFVRTYLTADATFSQPGTQSRWNWGSGLNPVWDGTQVGNTRTVEWF